LCKRVFAFDSWWDRAGGGSSSGGGRLFLFLPPKETGHCCGEKKEEIERWKKEGKKEKRECVWIFTEINRRQRQRERERERDRRRRETEGGTTGKRCPMSATGRESAGQMSERVRKAVVVVTRRKRGSRGREF
jgi:hypothetical protein